MNKICYELIMQVAGRAFEDGEHAFSLHVCEALENCAGRTEDQKTRSKKVRAEIIRALALRESSALGRNWLNTCALEVEGKIDYNTDAKKAEPPSKPDQLTRYLAIRVNPDLADGLKYRIKIAFDDEPHKIDVQLRNCTLSDSVKIMNSDEYICLEGTEEVSVKTSWKHFREAFDSGETNFDKILSEVKPDIKTFTKIMNCFD